MSAANSDRKICHLGVMRLGSFGELPSTGNSQFTNVRFMNIHYNESHNSFKIS